MGSTRRKFTTEHKAEAVSLVLTTGKPVRQVAENIGVHEMTLGRRVKDACDAQESSGQILLSIDERAEPERLRTENADLEMRVEFSKKAATWFASQKQ